MFTKETALMRRTKTDNITNLLQQFLRSEGLETPLNEFRLISAWGEVVGADIAAKTHAQHISQQRLHVKVDSAPLRTDLIMKRKDLVQKLNQEVKAQVITDIVFV